MSKRPKIFDELDGVAPLIPTPVYWLDTNYVILGGNDLCLSAIGSSARTMKEALVGKTYYDYYPKEIAYELSKMVKIVLETKQTTKVEEKITDVATGKFRYYETIRAPLFDDDGSIVGTICTAIEITERKEMEEELKIAKNAAESADHAKTEFIANMSHDIRTPLSGVVGLANILEDDLKDPGQKSLAHDLSQSGTELLNMLNEILDVISADNINTNDIHEEAFDLQHLVHGIMALEEPSTILKKIQLIANLDPNIPSVLFGDQKKIHHILLNLVGNAIKFTATGSVEIKITVLAKQDERVQLKFQVIETGKGIPPDALSKVFDAFYRVSPSYKGLDKGHGLGLHIAQSYSQLLGGNISVESKLDVGSTFSFSLAIKIADQDAIAQYEAKKPTLSNAHKPQPTLTPTESAHPVPSVEPLPNAPRVLVIEDNRVAQIIAQTFLHNLHCNFTCASDGESGLEIAKNQSFDLIISDVGLPGLSGLEVARALRAHEQTHGKPAVPIVGLTAHVRGSMHTECIEAGMNDVMIKPMNAEKIRVVYNKYLLSGTNRLPLHAAPTQELPIIPSIINEGDIGEDLPDTETKLFELDDLLIFDIAKARKILGNNDVLLKELIKTSITSLIPEELALMKVAHDAANWQTVSRIAHKLKGGFLSIGLTRAATACQYLERYYKAGHSALLEKLYAQVLATLDSTSVNLQSFVI